MPNCIQFIDKTKPGAGPLVLADVDDIIRENFNTPLPPAGVDGCDTYYCDWFDIIGFSLAMGETIPALRERYNAYAAAETRPAEVRELYVKMAEIVNFIDERFEPCTFVGARG